MVDSRIVCTSRDLTVCALFCRLRNQHRRTRSSRRTSEESQSGAAAEPPRESVILIVRRGPATAAGKASGAKSQKCGAAAAAAVVVARSPGPSPDAAVAKTPVDQSRSTTSSVSNEEPGGGLRSNARASKRPRLSRGVGCDAAGSVRDVPATPPPSRASSTVGLAVGGGGSGSASSTSRKLQSELHKIADSLSPKSTKVEGGTLGKRVRKQPTLYNPQTVPASQWQSDEFPPRRDSDDEDGDDDSDVSSTTTSKSHASKSDDGNGDETEPLGERKARRGQGHSVWCNFCGDDPAIKVSRSLLGTAFTVCICSHWVRCLGRIGLLLLCMPRVFRQAVAGEAADL